MNDHQQITAERGRRAATSGDALDLQQLKALVERVGGGSWATYGDATVYGDDGDSVCICHPNAGAMPEFIYESDHAAYIAAANPAVVLDLIARIESIEHQFKNFHRSLCARFGYVHDERDWKRDQVSLEEHIAGRIERPPPTEGEQA